MKASLVSLVFMIVKCNFFVIILKPFFIYLDINYDIGTHMAAT